MENYPILFPCPSSSSSYQISTSVVGSSHHGFNGMNNGQSSNAFLGLRPSDEMDHDDNHHQGRAEVSHVISERSIEVSDEVGNSSNNKKKGEKKVKKPRYAFQTRSQVDILDDGYRWRKYGQKAVKNNKFPRSYYRCTHQGCNVKKQVQRLTKDEGVVVTTYEGVHTHPIEKTTDNFEHILSQMQIYTPF
ncbi:hypothetical protein TanjilG_10317 [Lupinus angustifolius]|uniref:WRKY domain-containing protein n=1 Tax=Lupinus angustifolius TaxID=3871 RepID=A0A394DFC8_LUPAN|nr:PREDICTED: probable WRKY transcription factor 75 [Lupinus angustifolius]OIW19097.1 hypothetical protein TanjilG_10317 [Lupinus angustifolius]